MAFTDAIVDSLAVPILLLDKDLKILFANSAAASVAGITVEEMVGSNCRDVMDPGSNICEACPVEKVFESGDVCIVENETPDGDTWLMRGSPVKDDKNQVLSVVCFRHNITEIIKTRLSLKESEGRFRAFTENTTDITVIVTREGTYSYVSPSIEKEMGYKPEELIGQSMGIFMHPDDLPRALEVIKESIELTGITRHYKSFRVKHKNGSYVYYEALATALFDVPGVEGVVVNYRNISDRKGAQDELEKKNKELEAALDYNTKLTLMVAHDIRSPLVPIIGYSELLLNGDICELPEEAIESLQAIQASSEDLQKMADDFLMLSRVESGSMKIEKENISIGTYLEDLIKGIKAGSHEKAVSIIWSGDDFTIVADPVRLNQVLNNLIENSIKYSGDTVNIEIITEIREGRGRISVSDDGFGIDEQYLPHIFDPFFRVPDKEISKTKGTGLGLAITKDLIELMDGTIGVTSESGKGTTFTILLPLASG